MDMDKFKKKQLIIAKKKKARIEKRRKARETQEKEEQKHDKNDILQYLEELGKKQNKEIQYFYLVPSSAGLSDLLISLKYYYSTILKVGLASYPIFLYNFKSTHSHGIDYSNSYDTNLSDLLSFKQNNIICNSDTIEKIVCKYKNDISDTVHLGTYSASHLQFKNKIIKIWEKAPSGPNFKNSCYNFFFNSITFEKDLRNYFRDKIKELPSDIAFIQIRHTDRVCDYKQYFKKNNDFLHKYDKFYVATDNVQCLAYLRKKYSRKKFYNFTTYGSIDEKNLHQATSLSGYIKLRDVFFDLCMANKSVAWFSCSKGGFKRLAKMSYLSKSKCFRL